MTQVQVDKLELLQIDYLAAQLEGLYQIRSHGDFAIHVGNDGRVYFLTQSGRSFPFAPTVDWRQGGPIIENNQISIEKAQVGWRAHCAGKSVATGPTALIAAMRARIKLAHGEMVALGADAPRSST